MQEITFDEAIELYHQHNDYWQVCICEDPEMSIKLMEEIAPNFSRDARDENDVVCFVEESVNWYTKEYALHDLGRISHRDKQVFYVLSSVEDDIDVSYYI